MPAPWRSVAQNRTWNVLHFAVTAFIFCVGTASVKCYVEMYLFNFYILLSTKDLQVYGPVLIVWLSWNNTHLYSTFGSEWRLYNWATSWQNQQTDLCAQRRLRSAWASAQSDQSSLCAQWVAKDPNFLYAERKDSDQNGRMPRLIWVFAGRTCHFVGFVMRRLNYVVLNFWETILSYLISFTRDTAYSLAP